MQYLRRIQRGIDFVEEHLDAQLDLRDVSKAAGVSHWHFQRTFKALTGETLAGYVRARRLGNALTALLETDQRILDISLEAGFDSQEAFTRAFKRAFEITPGQARRLGSRARFVKKLRVDADYLQHINANVSLQPEVVERPAMRLVGLRTLLFGFESEKNNIASILPPLWEAFLPRLDEIGGRIPGACYGVIRPAEEDPDRIEYHAAVEVSAAENLPAEMVALELPASTYATFTHRGEPERLDQTVSYIYSTWLSQSDARPTYGADLEIYGGQWAAGSEESVMHYALPIANGQRSR